MLLTGWKKQLSKIIIIPHRYILGVMGFLAVVNAYTMRVCLSVAITEMVHSDESHVEKYDPDACNQFSLNSTIHTVTDYGNLYPWTDKQQGLILSSFYWGYVLTHIPGGIIAEKFGGKHSLGMGILCTALFTFVTPFVIYATNGDWVWVVVVRVIEGLGEGTTFPALNVLLAKWVPLQERSKIGTLVFAGSQIGTILGNSVSGALIDLTKDWASVFYLFGSLGILWVLFWTFLCYNDPESHPFITEKEKNFLDKNIKNVSKESSDIPWKYILTSTPLWALVMAQIGHDWGFFAMVTDLPKYMKDVLRFNVKENGLWSSLPYLVMWGVSMGSGWLCDFLIKRNILSVTKARKIFTSFASMGPAVFILAASYSGCNRILAIIMFTIAMGCMGTFYSGMKVNALDLSPNYAGTLMAITNGMGGLTGIIVPYLVGALTGDHTLGQWRVVFWITFAVFSVTNAIYVIFASGEVQSWNTYGDTSKSKNEETGHNLQTIQEKC